MSREEIKTIKRIKRLKKIKHPKFDIKKNDGWKKQGKDGEWR